MHNKEIENRRIVIRHFGGDLDMIAIFRFFFLTYVKEKSFPYEIYLIGYLTRC